MQFIKNNLVFLVVIFVALIHAQKFYLIPEIETGLLLLSMVFFFNKPYYFFLTVIIIFTTHLYSVLDQFYRFNSSDYPSIYTKAIVGGARSIDVSIVTIFLYGIIQNIKQGRILKPKFASLMFLTMTLGIFRTFTIPEEQVSYTTILFHSRNVMLVFGIYMIAIRIDIVNLRKLSYVAMVGWIATMTFAIIFPVDAPRYREYFGVDWPIYFGGEEYLSLGIYASLIMLISRYSSGSFSKVKKHRQILITLCLLAWILALISQRNGSIPYFIVVILVLYSSSTSQFLPNFYVKLTMFAQNFTHFVLSSILFLLKDISGSFEVYARLLEVSIRSLQHFAQEDPLSLIIGLGFGGLYEIIGLPATLDFDTAFGDQVGEKYRYLLWSIPFGRVILNSGMLGLLITLKIYISSIFKKIRADEYYLIISLISLIFWVRLTPVSSIPVGLALTICSLKDRGKLISKKQIINNTYTIEPKLTFSRE